MSRRKMTQELKCKEKQKCIHTTVELQWLEHLWNREKMFEMGIVRRANER